MRGAEERDFLFCKLFCYLSMIKSGMAYITQPELDSSATESTITERLNELLTRILDLHQRKGWMREVCTEAILLLLQTIPVPDKSGPEKQSKKAPKLASKLVKNDVTLEGRGLNTIASKSSVKAWLRVLLPSVVALLAQTSLPDMAAWQLMLLIGLQNIGNAPGGSTFRKELSAEYERQQHQQGGDGHGEKETNVMSMSIGPLQFDLVQDISEVLETLLASTAGYPKVGG